MPIWSLANFLDTSGLLPHGICLTWRPELLWLHALSDLVTALAYYSIPVALLVFAWRRQDLEFRWMFVLFGIFIMACGATHIMGLWTLWEPVYLAEGIVKAVTAVSSILTAIILWRLIPEALALPGPAQWEAVNNELRNEIVERRDVEAKVRHLNAVLEQRVAERTSELAAVNHRLADANEELRSEIEARKRAEAELAGLNADLEARVRQRTAELEATNQRLRGITNNLFDGVVLVDDGGLVAFANPSAQQLLQPGGGEMEGQAVDGVFRVRHEGRDSPFAEGPFAMAAAQGEAFCSHDAQFITSCGKALSVACACAPLKEGPERRGTIVSFHDIQALKTAQREAAQSARLASVGQLAAGIAHEINTPAQYVGSNLSFIGDGLRQLTPVLDAAIALGKGGAPEGELVEQVRGLVTANLTYLREELPQATEEALAGIRQISRIVLSMKEFSHPGTVGRTMADLNRAVENTLAVSHSVWRHAAEVETDFAEDLPPVSCLLPEINQVLLNLVTNAVDAIESSGKPPPGRIAISTRRQEGGVVIRVEDSGTGVPEAIRDRIFDPFFTTKVVGKGTGQGLAICRDIIVTKHHGRLEVGGEEGAGAVFTLWLPGDDAPA